MKRVRIHDVVVLTLVVAVGACIQEPPATAQMDMDLMMKWADATVVHWSVVGDYEGEELILNVATNGLAMVEDHVEIGFDYTSAGNGGLVGTPTFTDRPTELGALRNGAEGCRTPTIAGTYEHSTIESIEDGLGGQLAMTVRTDYPAGEVASLCSEGSQSSPARSTTTQEDLIVPAVTLLAMGDELDGGEISVSKDKKSLIVKRGGWTYRYTPTKVK
jgi:hypothetical protein